MTENNDDIAISVRDVTKTFRVPTEASNGIKQKIINVLKGKKGYREFTPLQDISFDIKKGDFFGIVGRNGSGKSTLLKLISGIYTPNEGAITVNGTLTPFIELGVGFNPDLTGRENIFLNGALLGFSKIEMDAMYDDIVGFAELEDFMDQKLKNYSSGMQVRLAFSIAIRAQSDILVLDEVLAVGDEAFQRKCNEYFTGIKETGKTVVLVTHDMGSVKKYCTSALLISDGKILHMGSPDEVANQYTAENINSEKKKGLPSETGYPVGLSKAVPKLKIFSHSGRVLTSNDTLDVSIEYQTEETGPTKLGISLIDEQTRDTLIDDSISEKTVPGVRRGKLYLHSFKYSLSLRTFNDRNFIFTASVYKGSKSSLERIAYTSDASTYKFAIRNGNNKNKGLLREKGVWTC